MSASMQIRLLEYACLGLMESFQVASNDRARARYLLILDGNTASGRSSLWMHAGAVLLKPDSVFSEWCEGTLLFTRHSLIHSE